MYSEQYLHGVYTGRPSGGRSRVGSGVGSGVRRCVRRRVRSKVRTDNTPDTTPDRPVDAPVDASGYCPPDGPTFSRRGRRVGLKVSRDTLEITMSQILFIYLIQP